MSDKPMFEVGEQVLVISRSGVNKAKIFQVTPTGRYRLEKSGSLFDKKGRYVSGDGFYYKTIVKLDDEYGNRLLKEQNVKRLRIKILAMIEGVDDVDVLARVESALNKTKNDLIAPDWSKAPEWAGY